MHTGCLKKKGGHRDDEYKKREGIPLSMNQLKCQNEKHNTSSAKNNLLNQTNTRERKI